MEQLTRQEHKGIQDRNRTVLDFDLLQVRKSHFFKRVNFIIYKLYLDKPEF